MLCTLSGQLGHGFRTTYLSPQTKTCQQMAICFLFEIQMVITKYFRQVHHLLDQFCHSQLEKAWKGPFQSKKIAMLCIREILKISHYGI